MDLLSDGSAADDFTSFKHERLQAALCQIAGRHQTIVTTANDDRVVVHTC